jgi:hypothetical protein
MRCLFRSFFRAPGAPRSRDVRTSSEFVVKLDLQQARVKGIHEWQDGRRWCAGNSTAAPASFSNMPSEVFRASRWTRGNHLFPTYIEISEKAISRRKRSWFKMDEMTINLSKVASVHIKTGLIWSDVLIESSGGSDPLASHGHTKADAIRIKDLIEEAQAQMARQPETPGS